MKKLILLSLSVFLGLQLAVSTSAKAQNFQIVASFGSTHHWGVPTAIVYEVDYFYPYHRFVHVNRYYSRNGRHLFFNVLLEDHGHFVELTFNRQGQIINRNFFSNYPLVNHICSSHCGYHSNYYYQQRVVCHAHNHGGHNHINWRQSPRQVRYSRPANTRVAYNHHRNSSYRGANKGYRVDRNDHRGQDNRRNHANRTDFDKPKRGNSDRIGNGRSSERSAVERNSSTRSSSRVASASSTRSSTSRSSSDRSSTSTRSASGRSSRN
jgi:hypothetical protein